jgi:hypothetical protein
MIKCSIYNREEYWAGMIGKWGKVRKSSGDACDGPWMSRRGAKVMSCHPAFLAVRRPLGMCRWPQYWSQSAGYDLVAGARRAPMWCDNWRLFLDLHIIMSGCHLGMCSYLDGVGADTLLYHLLGYCPARYLRGLVSAARRLLRWRRWQDAGGGVVLRQVEMSCGR